MDSPIDNPDICGDNGSVVGLLNAHGWHCEACSPRGISTVILDYQKFWGLFTDGWAGEVTAAHLRKRRVCSLPDQLGLLQHESAAGPPKFATNTIRWWVSHSNNRVRDAFKVAWERWEAVCDITVIEHSAEAIVRADFGRIDRRGGTLAWSELSPLDGRRFLRQKFDTSERWGFDTKDPAFIDLTAVACHEAGHALGLGHIRGDTGDLMNATYSHLIKSPQAGDIREIVRRYGEPQGEETGESVHASVAIKDVEYAGTLWRVERPN